MMALSPEAQAMLGSVADAADAVGDVITVAKPVLALLQGAYARFPPRPCRAKRSS